MANFSPSFPLVLVEEGGYKSNTTIKQVVKQNLKNLILTSPGERIMDPDFGVGLRNYLFETNNDSTASLLNSRIRQQLKKYMPFVELQVFQPTMDENEMIVTLKYFIIPLGEEDILGINL